jgi:hypothetical protein
MDTLGKNQKVTYGKQFVMSPNNVILKKNSSQKLHAVDSPLGPKEEI